MTRAIDEMIEKFRHSNTMRQMKGMGKHWISLHTRIAQDYLKAVVDAAIFHRDKRHIDTRWIE